jgi:diguanylate cyclase (GGDEF)-like protein
MLNAILTTSLTIILLAAAVLGIYLLAHCQSRKRNSLLLCVVTASIYLLGHLLTLTSISADEAFAGVKVVYLGGLLTASFAFLFIADYCDIRVHPIIKIPIYIVPLAMVILFWTTRRHHLVYQSYSFDVNSTHFLRFAPGSMYFAAYIFIALVCVAGIAIAVRQLVGGNRNYRSHLMMLFCTMPPFLAMVLDSIQEAFVLVDSNMNYLMSNPAARKIFGGLTSIRKGSSVTKVANWPEVLNSPQAVTSGNSVSFSLIDADGKTSHYSASRNQVTGNIGWIILIQDVTDNVILMKQLEEEAHADSLTGLFNRRFFMIVANQYYEQALRSKQPYCIMVLDLDLFKNINDSYGHLAGDELLKESAHCIKSNIRPYDLLARYGGEEFILLAPATDVQESFKLAERIRQNIETMVCRHNNHETLKVTCSIGLYAHAEGDTLSDMLEKADIAMYAAKKHGRNRVEIFSSGDWTEPPRDVIHTLPRSPA